MIEAGAETGSTNSVPRWYGGPVRRLLRLWRESEGPDVVRFVEGEGELEPAELVGVLRADQRQRWRAGQTVPAEWYLQRFPALADDPDGALDLVFSEWLLREEAGESPQLEQFLTRFPQFAAAIEVQVAFHVAFDSGGRPGDTAVYPTEHQSGVAGRSSIEPVADRPRANDYPVIPGYEIERELGLGAMGVVYEAYQVGLKRRVALKMSLAGPQADPEHLVRFQTEVEAAACLHHPNIVEIYET